MTRLGTRRRACGLTRALLLFALAGSAAGQDISFASVEDARQILSAQDDYVARLSPFDRAVRMRTERDVLEREYLDFLAAAALPWTDAEQKAVLAAWREVLPNAQRLGLPVPARVVLVKSSGREESDAPHTRANAIVLPAAFLSVAPRTLQHVVAHELFHVVSRANPGLAAPLYALIGFHYCGEIEVPAAFATRRITNPDAPRNNYCVQVRVAGEPTWVVPILYSKTPFLRGRGGGVFDYLQLGFLRVTRPADGRAPWPRRDDTVLTLYSLAGYQEQVGKNTGEVIHPEEIIADNVARLLTGDRKVPTPDLLARIEAKLREITQR